MKNHVVLRIPAVEIQTGLKRSQLYNLEKQNKFPKRLKLMGRASGWLQEEVANWIEERALERDAKV